MKYILILQLLFLCATALSNMAYAEPPSKEALLLQWEETQKNSAELKAFSKVDDNTYYLSFHNIPFEGNIALINIDIEELTYETTLPINYMGIIELKLPEALQKLKESYSRSFYRWQESTFFYYNGNSNTWLTNKEYNKLSNNIYQTLESTKLTKLVEQYSGEVTIGVVLLFIIMMLMQLVFLWKIKQKITK